MNLYHFSNKKFDTLKIEYFGYNSYTQNDAKYPIKRLFFYNTKEPQEYYFNNVDYCYIIKVDKKNIYDLDSDKLSLKKQFNFDIDNILEYIRKNYLVCSYTTSFKCYCVFRDIKPIKIKKLNQRSFYQC